jgi:hypothetical protein
MVEQPMGAHISTYGRLDPRRGLRCLRCPNITWTPPIGAFGALKIIKNWLELRKLWPLTSRWGWELNKTIHQTLHSLLVGTSGLSFHSLQKKIGDSWGVGLSSVLPILKPYKSSLKTFFQKQEPWGLVPCRCYTFPYARYCIIENIIHHVLVPKSVFFNSFNLRSGF